MTPAIPASRPDTIPSSKDFLNIYLRLFGHGHGYVHFDLFSYVATGFAELEIVSIHGKGAGESSTCCRLFKDKGDGCCFLHAMDLQIACHLVAITGFADLLISEMDLRIFRHIKPFFAFGVFVLQTVACIYRRHIDGYVELRCSRVLFVKCYGSFKTLEDTRSVIAGKGDGITFSDLPGWTCDEGKCPASQDQDGGY